MVLYYSALNVAYFASSFSKIIDTGKVWVDLIEHLFSHNYAWKSQWDRNKSHLDTEEVVQQNV